MKEHGWTVTLHCDLGCDPQIPKHTQKPNNVLQRECATPAEELTLAKENHGWWKDILEKHYPAFFDEANTPKPNFRKIQHLQVNYMYWHSNYLVVRLD